jgi:hypothetical protein
MTPPKRIATVAAAFDALGGYPGIGRITGAKVTTICWWKVKNRFPAKFTLKIDASLRERGYEADPAIYGQVAESEAAG